MSKVKSIDGLPVIDAKQPIRITITKNDVARADPKEPADCAVARACRRQLHAIEARVHLSRVYVRLNKGNWARYATPKAMRSEIIAFDRGGQFEPGEFELQPVPPSQALTGRRQGALKPKGQKRVISNKKRKPHVVTNVRGGPA